MQITRRQLIVLGGAVALTGCTGGGAGAPGSPAAPASLDPIDAGPLSQLVRHGVDARFKDTHGFYLVRTRTRLFAQSAICTHRNCKLDPTATGFLCRCHGSTFTPDGTVTKGPATRDLPRFAIQLNAAGHVLVHPARRFQPKEFDAKDAYIPLSAS